MKMKLFVQKLEKKANLLYPNAEKVAVTLEVRCSTYEKSTIHAFLYAAHDNDNDGKDSFQSFKGASASFILASIDKKINGSNLDLEVEL